MNSGTINAVRYNQRARDTVGGAVSLLDGVLYKLQGGVEASLSYNGTLAYLRGDSSASLSIFDSHGTVVSKTAVEGAYANPETVARLEQSVTDNIKRFEYTLRRRLDANASQVFLSGTDDVPEQYRKLVEQYYRSLSKGGGK